MRTNSFRTLFGLATVASIFGAQGCVADRPSRNGVFDENQYIRKDFLVQNGPNGSPDPGWYMKATVVQTSTPNPLANLDLFTGAENQGALVRFNITSDKLQLVDMRELSNDPVAASQNATTGAIVNAWPVTNVDLKYQINLDGEKTNFYQENQELDWQVRQWVKLNFDKNDLSDIAGLGAYQSLFLNKCTDAGNSSASLVPGSFQVDTANNYMQWTLSVTAPVNLTDADCMQAFGSAGTDFLRMGRSTVTMNVMYSMVRAAPVDATAYTPLVVDEKDSIRHKYGALEITNYSRNMSSGLQSARELVLRYNPNKPIVWYFAQGYPAVQKDMWTRPGGIVEQTNALLTKAGAKAQLSILNYNDGAKLGDAAGPARQYGDVRYNFIRWESNLDTDSPFLGVTNFEPDLRTGELVSASINIADAPLKDFLGQRTAAYIQSAIGSDPFADPPIDWTKTVPLGTPQPTLSANCTAGASLPLVPKQVQESIYANSTLYQKMALYLPPAPDGASKPGPTDYVYKHTGAEGATFNAAYLKFIPYTTYADPLYNQFVTPESGDLSDEQGLTVLVNTLHGETQFQHAMAALEHGGGLASLQIGDGPSGMQAAYDAVDNVRQLWQAHRDYTAAWQLPHSTMRGDTPAFVSFPQVVARSNRKCLTGGGGANASGATHWETFAEWQAALIQSYYEGIVWHEFGHVMGLEHNFMGSIDKANWPTYQAIAPDGTKSTQYGKMSSSIMEYSVSYDDTYWNNGSADTNTQTGWLPYDQAAIAWIYGNNLSPTTVGPVLPPAGAAKGDTGISGQVSATAPWNDPLGFNGANEREFLFCTHQHIRYTPLCKMFDVGSTPSEIAAADIEQYEWNYKWRNFRNYYKIWDDSSYSGVIANIISESRRWNAMGSFDWNPNEFTDKLIRIGIAPPAGAGAVNAGNFYSQLTDHFKSDEASAEALMAAFHEAIIQQGSGQRPYATAYDPYFGDVTQQGIAPDKELAFINWLGLWPYDNYDPSQAAGFYGSSMTVGPGQSQPAQMWSTAASMLGEKGSWDAYPIFFPSAVSLYAHDTQNVVFTGLGYPQMRDWIGGHVFVRVQDALDYFRQIAADNPTQLNGCANFDTCTYNPMDPQSSSNDIGHSSPVNAFVGPDSRRWSWMYIADRNQYYFVDQDRNPSSYFQVYSFNQDVQTLYDDGNTGGVYALEANTKFMIDAFDRFGGSAEEQ